MNPVNGNYLQNNRLMPVVVAFAKIAMETARSFIV